MEEKAPAPGWRDMGLPLAWRMNALNARFYQEQAASFSATRHAAWPGWERCLDVARAAGLGMADGGGGGPRQPLRVLDLACGNLRFARFLEGAGARVADHLAIDDAPELVATADAPAAWHVRYRRLDVVGSLLDGSFAEDLAEACPGPRDLAACFGFLHHVPTLAARSRLLEGLVRAVRPGGIICVSFWRFMSDAQLAGRARETTAAACIELGIAPDALGANDYLLGWQGAPHAWRYCHHFDEDEVSWLARSLEGRAAVMGRFQADGRTGSLDEYLVLRRI